MPTLWRDNRWYVETGKKSARNFYGKRQHPESLRVSCVCLSVSEAERETCTMYQAAANLTLSVSRTVGTQSDAPSTKDEQMGKPTNCPSGACVIRCVYMFYVRVCVCCMFVPVHHITSLRGRLTSSSRRFFFFFEARLQPQAVKWWRLLFGGFVGALKKDSLVYLISSSRQMVRSSIAAHTSQLTAELNRVKVMHNAMFLTLRGVTALSYLTRLFWGHSASTSALIILKQSALSPPLAWEGEPVEWEAKCMYVLRVL